MASSPGAQHQREYFLEPGAERSSLRDLWEAPTTWNTLESVSEAEERRNRCGARRERAQAEGARARHVAAVLHCTTCRHQRPRPWSADSAHRGARQRVDLAPPRCGSQSRAPPRDAPPPPRTAPSPLCPSPASPIIQPGPTPTPKPLQHHQEGGACSVLIPGGLQHARGRPLHLVHQAQRGARWVPGLRHADPKVRAPHRRMARCRAPASLGARAKESTPLPHVLPPHAASSLRCRNPPFPQPQPPRC
jgi:hypothetical protein